MPKSKISDILKRKLLNIRDFIIFLYVVGTDFATPHPALYAPPSPTVREKAWFVQTLMWVRI